MSRPLWQIEKDRLLPYFSSMILNKVRIAEVPDIPEPWIYPALRFCGVGLPVNLSAAAALTLADVVLVANDHAVSGSIKPTLLFHEMVHVVQYDALGIDQFIEKYLLAENTSSGNPLSNYLERQAYELEERYASAPQRRFDAESEVRMSLII